MGCSSKLFDSILVHHLVLLGIYQVIPKSLSDSITSLLMLGQASLLAPINFHWYPKSSWMTFLPLVGSSKGKTSSFPSCSILPFLQKNCLCLSPLELPTLLLFQPTKIGCNSFGCNIPICKFLIFKTPS